MADNKEYMHLVLRRKATSSHIHGFFAFTLAETLITLLVIGVVAVLTIPTLTQQITNYTLNKQKKVFSSKWAEGLRRMRADGKLENSYTTQEFIGEMGKYFAIASVCNPNNLTGCFAEKITTYESNANGEVFEVKDLKSAKNFNKSEEDSPVYGIKFTDGTSMLLAYKKDCTGIAEGNTNGNHTQCLLYVYDVNGDKSPNSYGGNTGVGVQKNDKELSESDRETINKGRDLVGNASITKGNPYGLSFIIADSKIYTASEVGYLSYNGYSKDYWYAAKQKCESMNLSLPTREMLEEMAEKIYKNANCSTSSKNGRIYYYNCNQDLVLSSGIMGAYSTTGLSSWTTTPNYFRAFNSDSSDYNNDYNWNHTHGSTFFCVQ